MRRWVTRPRILCSAAMLVLMAGAPSIRAQEDKSVEQKEVDAAIRSGIRYLKEHLQGPEPARVGMFSTDELVLLTFLHAGVPENDGRFQALFKRMKEAPLRHTYNVSLQAMVLEALDRVKHQRRIAECGQFLVDTGGGSWGYGGRGAAPPAVAGAGPDAPTPRRKDPKPRGPRILLRPTLQAAPGAGDPSNSQYAAMGLWACVEANVLPPAETLQAGKAYWSGNGRAISPATYSGGGANALAGGLACYILYRRALGEAWEEDPLVRDALVKLGDTFSVKLDPKLSRPFDYYYHLYSLERGGILSARRTFGTRDWYQEGARELLKQQKAFGGWEQPLPKGQPHHAAVTDTCFAILFLKRATLAWEDVETPSRNVPSVDRPAEKKP